MKHNFMIENVEKGNIMGIFMKHKNMKVMAGLMLLGVIFTFWGCGNKGKNMEISEDKLLGMVDKLTVCDGFESKLEKVDESVVLNSYKISDADVSVLAGYIGEGASAEEITLFKCNDTDKVKELTERYLENKEENYKGYLPKEAEKIGKAIIKEYKGYVLVCIANEENEINDVIKKEGAR